MTKKSNAGKIIYVTMLLIITGAVFLGGSYLFSGRRKPAVKNDDELLVVTSFYPMYIAALNVTDHVEGIRLQNLSEPKTGCLHDYQLTPEDMILLSEADVFIINGGGIEGFISDIASEYPDLYIIDASAGIELLSEEEEHEHEHEDEEEYHHDHGVNSHIWMSVPRYRQQV
ncbi:MAG: metal ABC transporter substrate-binding protein, partial [Lachnospiraceae bacterium]|nr:metal ABC transporter substrate-binding protein [Lachnospiraceae bacterium]